MCMRFISIKIYVYADGRLFKGAHISQRCIADQCNLPAPIQRRVCAVLVISENSHFVLFSILLKSQLSVTLQCVAAKNFSEQFHTIKIVVVRYTSQRSLKILANNSILLKSQLSVTLQSVAAKNSSEQRYKHIILL